MKSSSQITTGENLTTKEQKLKTFVLNKIARLTSPYFADDIKDASMTIMIDGRACVNVFIGHNYNNGYTYCPITVNGWILNKNEKKQILENIDVFTENTPSRINKVFDFASAPSATSSSMIINYLKKKQDEKEQILNKSPYIAYRNDSYTIQINIIYNAEAHNGVNIDGGITKALEQETSLIGFNSNLISELKEKKIPIPCDDRIFSLSELTLIEQRQLSQFISIQESDQKSYQKSEWFISIQKSALDTVLHSLIGDCNDSEC